MFSGKFREDGATLKSIALVVQPVDAIILHASDRGKQRLRNNGYTPFGLVPVWYRNEKLGKQGGREIDELFV